MFIFIIYLLYNTSEPAIIGSITSEPTIIGSITSEPRTKHGSVTSRTTNKKKVQ